MQPKLIVEQKITAFVNRYKIYETRDDGHKGSLKAFVEQKRVALKEKISFYSDESKSQLLFTLRAEKVLDVHGRYMVEDQSGRLIGNFKKEFAKSLINSTWNILDDSGQPKIQVSESNQALAIFRRFGGYIPIIGGILDLLLIFFRYHFTFTDIGTNEEVGRYKKTALLRDHYLLSFRNEAYQQLDWRVMAAQAVALDALQSR